MAYVFTHDESVADGMVRILAAEVEGARRDLVDLIRDDPAEAIHDCRKRCKRIRAAARLVRPAMRRRAFAAVNGGARDAARELSAFRDATSMALTFDRVARLLPISDDDRAAMEAVSRSLTERQGELDGDLGADHPAIVRARGHLDHVAERVVGLELRHGGWAAIGPGLAAIYARGRDALDVAADDGTAVHFHEWRKRAKDTRYHVELLLPSAPDLLQPLEEAFHHLTDALGDGHDLHVIADGLRSGDAPMAVDDLDRVLAVVDGARFELERRAILLGRRIYAEPPKRFAARLGRYWELWHADGADIPTGGLDVVFPA